MVGTFTPACNQQHDVTPREWSQVISESSRWLRSHQDDPDLLFVRGKALYLSGQMDQAPRLPPHTCQLRRSTPRVASVRRCALAASRASALPNHHHCRAQALKHLGEALRLDPDHSNSRKLRALLKVTAHLASCCGLSAILAILLSTSPSLVRDHSVGVRQLEDARQRGLRCRPVCCVPPKYGFSPLCW